MQSKDRITEIKKHAMEFIQMSSYSVDPCTIATAIALSDEKVIERLAEKFDKYIFNGHRCLKYTSDWELVYIYFDFDCPPDVYCFIKPAFAVSVNLITKKVVDIVDPFIISEMDALKKSLEIQDNTIYKQSLPWPKLRDISVKLFLENNKIVLVAYYKGDEKYRTVIADISSELCDTRDDIDLFSVSIMGIGFTVYLRYLWICIKADESKADYSFQIWARSGPAKTKLSDTIEGSINWRN
ncbi:hypothetical protein [Lacrimispora amygdalina]|uniref:hypothetical protein n=1 Tax=Lacrimispora amygdalina TaxID=253257 RepID=UPI000BE42241|nr:hypothetical protein [Lacrimispora amygdalina]